MLFRGQITKSARDIRIVGGNLNRFWQNSTTYVGTARNFVIYPRYRGRTSKNDIAIINVRVVKGIFLYFSFFRVFQLQEPVQAQHKFFRSIPLNTVPITTNTTCTVSGWGDLKYQGKLSKTLKMVNVTTFDSRRCKLAYRNLPPNTLCAGAYEGGKDSCQVELRTGYKLLK